MFFLRISAGNRSNEKALSFSLFRGVVRMTLVAIFRSLCSCIGSPRVRSPRPSTVGIPARFYISEFQILAAIIFSQLILFQFCDFLPGE